ncbi:MAG: RnfABCDGE type electron transport complex subunit B [Methylococcaceae bacterium]|nr:RnfABCDGE type electron transport complex subunit B [Methylococcaceae bacterium]
MQLKSIIDKIEEILPQTQCCRCHFPGCRPYAEAIAAGRADINQCPPGGMVGIRLLAGLLGTDPKPLNPLHGSETPARVAMIVEDDCIGCAKCIQACPVDAIVGAQKQLHTVIESECTGCELCVPPCPVDCIVLNALPVGDPRSQGMDMAARRNVASRAKARYDARTIRQTRQKQELKAHAQKKREALRRLRLSDRHQV